MSMEAIRGFLAPFGLDSSSIRNTLVCTTFSFLPRIRVGLCLSQKLVVIGGTVETARRASVSEWNGFIDCSCPHFDQEDIPYDWQVRFITFACAYSCPNLYRLMHWLSKVRSAWSQYRRCHLLAFALRINSNLDGFAVESLKSRRVQSVGVS